MLRLGLIGFSPGNGHPYSWSALCNGYRRDLMEDCGFPTIPRYLEHHELPADGIASPGEEPVRVTHVWTDDPADAKRIAETCLIQNVVDDVDTMIEGVDAVLLARDDAENHRRFSAPVLEAGLPIYIDKPIGTRRADAEALYALQRREGQIFTCSATRYAAEMDVAAGRERVGDLLYVEGVAPNRWERYIVHVVEPIVRGLPERGAVVDHRCLRMSGQTSVVLHWQSGVRACLSALGRPGPPIAIRLVGTDGVANLALADTFTAFRAALRAFVRGVRAGESEIPQAEALEVVDLIELGVGGDDVA